MSKSLKKVQDLYDKRILSSQDAIKAAGQWGSDEVTSRICKEILEKIKIKPSDQVLELGCGSGVLGDWIVKYCKNYVGLDLSFGMVKFFLNNTVNKKNIDLIQSTINETPLQNETFDVILVNSVTMYFEDEQMLKQTFDEIMRLVKKNGIIFIGENIVPGGYPWELSWFQALSSPLQFVAKPYIRIRKWLSKKNSRFVGKWKGFYYEVSPKFVFKYFKEYGQVIQSKAATYTIKEKISNQDYRGSRRMDFLIKLKN